MDVFTIQDLSERSSELVRDAQAGRLSVVTQEGHPLFVALPFNKRLLHHGIGVALAIKLWEEGTITLAKAARLADLSIEALLEKLTAMGVLVVAYPAAELDAELAALE